MGKLILCSGVRTTRPYVFPSTGIRVYSIEELCYYLYHHVYMIDEDMFCDTLFDFIGSDLKLIERAEKLRILKKQNTDIKTMVTIILCSADYYTEYEIKSLLKILDEIIGMPMVKRSCIKAGQYLKERKYAEAAAEYERLINSTEASELTPEEYGDLFHNLALARLHITGLKEASKLYRQAYERNHKEASLRQYLYTLRISGNEAAYRDAINEFQVSKEMDNEIIDFLTQKEAEARDSVQMLKLKQLRDRKTQGKINEFYKEADEIITAWKSSIRQNE